MVADKSKKAKTEEEDVEQIDGELVLSIEKLQEIQDDLEKVNYKKKTFFLQSPCLILLENLPNLLFCRCSFIALVNENCSGLDGLSRFSFLLDIL